MSKVRVGVLDMLRFRFLVSVIGGCDDVDGSARSATDMALGEPVMGLDDDEDSEDCVEKAVVLYGGDVGERKELESEGCRVGVPGMKSRDGEASIVRIISTDRSYTCAGVRASTDVPSSPFPPDDPSSSSPSISLSISRSTSSSPSPPGGLLTNGMSEGFSDDLVDSSSSISGTLSVSFAMERASRS